MLDLEKDISRAIGLLRAAGKPDKYLEQKYAYLKEASPKLKLDEALSEYFENDPIISGRFLCKVEGFSAFSITGVIIHLKKAHGVYIKSKKNL